MKTLINFLIIFYKREKMVKELEEIQILAQLIDNMDIASDKLAEAYEKNDAEKFNKARDSILDFKNKISEIVK